MDFKDNFIINVIVSCNELQKIIDINTLKVIDNLVGEGFYYNRVPHQPIYFSYSLSVLQTIAKLDGGFIFTKNELLFKYPPKNM